MKVGIIIHSQTGHTAFFARMIAERLKNSDIEADVHLLRTAKHAKPGAADVELRKIPDVEEYDIVLAGGPVWAFKASPVIMKFLHSIESLKGKKSSSFVTMGLPFNWMGGNQAVKKMNTAMENKGSETIPGHILQWLLPVGKDKLKKEADAIVEKLKNL